MVLPGLELFPEIGGDLVDAAGDAAEIAALGAGIDLVHRLDIGLVGAARHRIAGKGRDILQFPRHRLRCRRGGSGIDRRIADVAHRADQVLRRLHRNVVGNAVLRVGPEIGLDLLGGTESRADVVADVGRLNAELQGPRTIDVDQEVGGVLLLL